MTGAPPEDGPRGAPRPVVLVRPAAGEERPIVVEVPHAGVGVPEEVRGEIALDEAALLRDADLFVDRLYREAPARGATLLYSEVSRVVVDLNRDEADVDGRVVSGHPAPRADSPRGVIWRLATDGQEAQRAALPYPAYLRRIERWYRPYHAALDGEVARLLGRFGRVVVLSGHSMPSRGGAAHDEPGRRRADVVPGDLEGRACAPWLTRAALDHFYRAGLSVAANDPYKGGNTTRRLGRPEAGVDALQIELNRDLYMDEATFAIRPEGFARMASLCLDLVEILGTRRG